MGMVIIAHQEKAAKKAMREAAAKQKGWPYLPPEDFLPYVNNLPTDGPNQHTLKAPEPGPTMLFPFFYFFLFVFLFFTLFIAIFCTFCLRNKIILCVVLSF